MTSPSRAVFVVILQVFFGRLESTKSACFLLEGFAENEYSSSDDFRFLEMSQVFLRFVRSDFAQT